VSCIVAEQLSPPVIRRPLISPGTPLGDRPTPPPVGSSIKATPAHVIAPQQFFETLALRRRCELPRRYAKHADSEDPIDEVLGLAAAHRVFAHGNDRVQRPRFAVVDTGVAAVRPGPKLRSRCGVWRPCALISADRWSSIATTRMRLAHYMRNSQCWSC
jgi:hypothetical protein